MPIFDLDQSGQSVLQPTGQLPAGAEPQGPPTMAQAANQDMIDHPTWALGAAFRQGELVTSQLSRKDMGTDNLPEDPSYSAWDEIKGTKYEPFWSSFVSSNNARFTAATKQQIDMEQDDRRTLAASGWRGGLSQIAAGLTDIPAFMAIPEVEAPAFVAKAGPMAAGAVKGAANFGIGMTAIEGALQSSQNTRPLSESMDNIGGGVLLGSLLGGVVGHLGGQAQIAEAQTALRDVALNRGVPAAADVGAARVQHATVGDLTIDGATTDAIARATSVNPNLRLNQSPVALARQTGQEFGENTLYQAMHSDGESLGPAVETTARMQYKARLADALGAHQDAYNAMKEAGTNMPVNQFDEAVGQAMRRGDTAENPFVAQAASAWRAKVFEPFKQEAIELGKLPADVNVADADSYFSRMWQTGALNAREAEFKDRVTGDIAPQMAGDFSAQRAVLQNRLSRLDQEHADLFMDPATRAQTLATLEKQGGELDTANSQHIETLGQINDLRQKAQAATDAGDRATAKDARAQIQSLKEQGGQGLKDYVAQRSALRSRYRQVDLNYAGMSDRVDNLVNSLSSLEDTNARQLNRLVTKGQRFAAEAQRLDPAKYAERISELKTSFAQVAQRADRMAKRAADAVENLKGKAGEDTAPVEAPVQKIFEQHAAQQQAYAERLNKIATRLERWENFDPVATLQDVRDGVDAMVAQVNKSSLMRGEKSQRLKDRIARLDPAKLSAKAEDIRATQADMAQAFRERWRVKGADDVDVHGSSVPDFTDAAREVADEVHQKLTGRYGDTTGASSNAEYALNISRGPLKDRTFHVRDTDYEDFMESNVRAVGERYARIMSGENELARKLGSGGLQGRIEDIAQAHADLRDHVQSIGPDYKQFDANGKPVDPRDVVRALAMQGQGAARVKALFGKADDLATVKEKALLHLAGQEKADIRDVRALADLIRGTYKRDANSGSYARVVRSVMAYNYLRTLGNFIPGNLSIIYRPAMVHGLQSYVQDGLAPLIKNLDAVIGKNGSSAYARAMRESNLAGIGNDALLHGRMQTFAEMGDPYRPGSAVERLLQNGTKIGTAWNGMALFFDHMRNLSSMMVQHRIIDGIQSGKDARYLAYLGIDQNMAGRIGDELAQHGEHIDGIHVANTEKWASAEAARTYRAAVAKDVGSIIHEKSVGDLPLFANTPTGRMLLQFKTFSIAAHSRAMLRGMQEDPTRFVTGLIAQTSLGMMSAYLTAMRGGSDSFEKFKQQVGDNPLSLIGHGLDKSGLFTLPFEALNAVKALGSVKNGHVTTSPDLARLLGPTAGLTQDVAQAAGFGLNAASSQAGLDTRGASKQQTRAAAGLVPFSSYVGMRDLLQMLQGNHSNVR